MDDLGKMLGGLTGGGSGGGSPAAGGDIVGAISGLVGGSGGLEGLVGQLKSGGLGEAVGSWVGMGPNKDVDPAHLASALGPDKVGQLVQQSGLPVDQLLPLLASALPGVINAVTPHGQVPNGDATAGIDVGGLLKGLSEAANAGPGSPLGALGGLLGGKGR
jgi:uncharacterized protein YidB (DUF937 family)